MFDVQKFMTFLTDPMSAHKAADLPVDPMKFLAGLEQSAGQMGLGARMPTPGGPTDGVGLQAPKPGGAPDGQGLTVPPMGMADVSRIAATPGMDWMRALSIGGPAMMSGLQQQQPRLSPPGHVFVGGPRQVQLNPYFRG